MIWLSMFDTLARAGFVATPGKLHQWRHATYSYLTVECAQGIWTMQSPNANVEINADADVQPALELLSGHAFVVRKVEP
jgi:hypothetical protein